MDILRLSKEGGGVATCVATPTSFEDFGVRCIAVVPGLTRLRLGVKHCVHLRAFGQLKYVQRGHAHLLSSGVHMELGEACNCGDVDRLSEVAPIL